MNTNNGYAKADHESQNLSTEEKIKRIQVHFKKIMRILGLDLSDDSFKNTPERVAKMYVKEIFSGLNKKHCPNITTFDNESGYNEMLIEKDITLYSYCAHHFVPIIGKVHVAYFPSDKIVGLSKINRLVNFLAKKPQVQEKLTVEVGKMMMESLETQDVAVLIDADHLCVASRGIKDTNSSTRTSFFKGKFKGGSYREEFIESVG
jgi:GTP cyclohydrolase I